MSDEVVIDSLDSYNRLVGLPTRHPLVSVFNVKDVGNADFFMHEHTFRYGVYALFLKNTRCCQMHYGHGRYDYSDGTVTSFAPGQVVHSTPIPGMDPDVVALMFHPDLIRGTELGRQIDGYHFFEYSSNEALHMSEQERGIYMDCVERIRLEMERPVDKFSRRLICQNIGLLLDYCMRFYDRQFIMREEVNSEVVRRFNDELRAYFLLGDIAERGLPSVAYFAEKCCLSRNYFGDLVKKETGLSPQEHIQNKVLEMAKDMLLDGGKSVSEVAYDLGFQYSQHFNRYFKRGTGMTPTEFRQQMMN